jgi:hypothetical protein
MSPVSNSASYYLAPDMGAWNCDRNGKSRDALVILDSACNIVGVPWRKNLRDDINRATSTREWLAFLFSNCGVVPVVPPEDYSSITMGIDTPLGFSDEFKNLIVHGVPVKKLDKSSTNPYLYRATERFLFERGINPLSPIKDMIGSQATKGIHALRKFAPEVESCGVWGDGKGFHAIEAYPSAAKRSESFMSRFKVRLVLGHNDKNDALICALIAYLFDRERDSLIPPGKDISESEGWIWYTSPEGDN